MPNALNVGWLSSIRYCPTGTTSDPFRRKLFQLCTGRRVRACGFHTCLLGLCKLRPRRWGTPVVLDDQEERVGSGIIVVRGTHHAYVAPDLIYHYVTQHRYRPPPAFIDAVLGTTSPPMLPGMY